MFRFPNYGEGMLREDKIIIYRWSGANRYIQLCDAAKWMVVFGDFRRGTTGHCYTFDNKALCEEGYVSATDL